MVYHACSRHATGMYVYMCVYTYALIQRNQLIASMHTFCMHTIGMYVYVYVYTYALIQSYQLMASMHTFCMSQTQSHIHTASTSQQLPHCKSSTQISHKNHTYIHTQSHIHTASTSQQIPYCKSSTHVSRIHTHTITHTFQHMYNTYIHTQSHIHSINQPTTPALQIFNTYVTHINTNAYKHGIIHTYIHTQSHTQHSINQPTTPLLQIFDTSLVLYPGIIHTYIHTHIHTYTQHQPANNSLTANLRHIPSLVPGSTFHFLHNPVPWLENPAGPCWRENIQISRVRVQKRRLEARNSGVRRQRGGKVWRECGQ